MSNPILFFDGECKFCNRWVLFILKKEKDKKILFAHLQEAEAIALLQEHTDEELKDSIYFLEKGKLYYYSSAAIKIASYLNSPYAAVRHLSFVPRFIRDGVYRLIAKYRIFFAGKNESCIYPTALEGRIYKPSDSL